MIWRLLCSLGRLCMHGRTEELWRLNKECHLRRADNVRLRDERDRAIAERSIHRLQGWANDSLAQLIENQALRAELAIAEDEIHRLMADADERLEDAS